MKGYRTLAFGVVTILLGLLGRHVSPDLVNQWLDIIFAGLGLGVMVLRALTTTPLGAHLPPASPGQTSGWLADITQPGDQAAPTTGDGQKTEGG